MTLPLSGLKVLDMALLLPGALAATWLGDLGAEVTRVEPAWGHGVLGWDGGDATAYFAPLQSGKRVLALNFAQREGRERLLALVDEADVLIEGFRPGTLARRGLGYEALAARNPRLVYCAISAFGSASAEAGHDANFMALAGLLAQNRGADGQPHLYPVQLADVGGGTLPAMVAILAALFARERSGRGQFLDVSLLDGAMAWNYYTLPIAQRPALEPSGRGLGLLSGGALAYNVYECADGRHLVLGGIEPHFWRAVCDCLGRPDLIPFAFNPEPGAAERLADFRALFRSRPRGEWLALFAERECLASPLVALDELLAAEEGAPSGRFAREEGLLRARFPVAVRG